MASAINTRARSTAYGKSAGRTVGLTFHLIYCDVISARMSRAASKVRHTTRVAAVDEDATDSGVNELGCADG